VYDCTPPLHYYYPLIVLERPHHPHYHRHRHMCCSQRREWAEGCTCFADIMIFLTHLKRATPVLQCSVRVRVRVRVHVRVATAVHCRFS
jgi:hypothetical protein